MCHKETAEEKAAREAKEGTGSTKKHFAQRTCWAILFILLCLLQAFCAFPLYIAFVVNYGYLVATCLAALIGIICAILYWEQCCKISTLLANILFWIFILAELVLIGFTVYALVLVIQNYNVFTSPQGCYKLLSNPQYTALISYGCDSIKSLLQACIAGCIVTIVIACFLIWILTRLRRHRRLANKHKSLEEGQVAGAVGADGKPIEMQPVGVAGAPVVAEVGAPTTAVPTTALVPGTTVVPTTGIPATTTVTSPGAPTIDPFTPLSPLTTDGLVAQTTTYAPPPPQVVQTVPSTIVAAPPS